MKRAAKEVAEILGVEYRAQSNLHKINTDLVEI